MEPAQLHDIADGLWIWRLPHPQWTAAVDWQPTVTSVCVESGGEVLLLDPLLPPAKSSEFWTRLNRTPPTAAVVLKPDHVRDIDSVVRLFGVRAFGPNLFWQDDVPRTKLEAVEPGMQLPGGLQALYDGRGKNETPLWLPAHRTIVFADALTERDGNLLVWNSRFHQERALPALRSMLELPFERVIISHELTSNRISLIYYLFVNLGALLAIPTSYIAKYVGFWLAFLVPGLVYLMLPLLLFASKPYTKIGKPQGSELDAVFKIIAISFKIRKSICGYFINIIFIRENRPDIMRV